MSNYLNVMCQIKLFWTELNIFSPNLSYLSQSCSFPLLGHVLYYYTNSRSNLIHAVPSSKNNLNLSIKAEPVTDGANATEYTYYPHHPRITASTTTEHSPPPPSAPTPALRQAPRTDKEPWGRRGCPYIYVLYTITSMHALCDRLGFMQRFRFGFGTV